MFGVWKSLLLWAGYLVTGRIKIQPRKKCLMVYTDHTSKTEQQVMSLDGLSATFNSLTIASAARSLQTSQTQTTTLYPKYNTFWMT